MLQAFVDESISKSVFTLAGYVAPVERWKAFSNEWQQFLEMKPSIKYFKFQEAMSLSGEFSFWREQARDEKMALLYRVIGEHATASVSCAVRLDDHRQVFGRDDVPARLRSPYFMLFYGIIQQLATYQQMVNLNGPVDFIFDERVIEQDKVLEIWDFFNNIWQGPKDLLGAMPRFGNDATNFPLQAADMLVGRMRRSFDSTFGPVTPIQIPQFRQQKNVRGLGCIWSKNGMMKIRNQMKTWKPVVSGTYAGRPFFA